MAVKPGKKFCVEHGLEGEEEEDGEGDRAPCPYDPKHSCYVSKMQKHMRKCNSRPRELPGYITPGVNARDADYPGARDEVYPIGAVPGDVLLDLVRMIEKVYDEEGLECGESILSHCVLQSTIDDSQLGMNAKKHLLQNSSLLRNMEESGFFTGNGTFVEFGAGRGQLGFWISQAVSNSENCALLLIDKASHRHKSDNKLKGVSPVRTLRIRTDIADLDLSKIGFLTDSGNEIYGVAKHLCGVATDLALRCLVNGKANGLNVAGAAVAFCCHHRCSWSSFVGKKFLLDVGFAPHQFSALCSISSWATCGSGKPRARADEPEEDRGEGCKWSQEVREGIGRKCKMILNHARMKYLEGFGFQGKLIYYVQRNVSPENVCLIAKSNSSSFSFKPRIK